MKIVFSNFTRLSIAEMPDGGTLTVTTRKRGASIFVEFSNTGVRHTSEEAGELFLPIAVAKGLVPKGIGLYMAHNIIHSYCGDIEVRSHKGKGTTFRITIPVDSGRWPDGVSN
jgi:signal transduction histidine kinase